MVSGNGDPADDRRDGEPIRFERRDYTRWESFLAVGPAGAEAEFFVVGNGRPRRARVRSCSPRSDG